MHAHRRPSPGSQSRAADKHADGWNRRYPVGQEVDYRSFIDAPVRRTRTRSEAYVLSGHTAVVMLAGISGAVSLDSLTPIIERALTTSP